MKRYFNKWAHAIGRALSKYNLNGPFKVFGKSSTSISFLTALVVSHLAMSQQAVFQMDFDEQGFEEQVVSREEAVYMVDLQQSQFVEGLSGKALDLSANASLRRPVKLDKSRFPILSEQASFGVQIWVKTLPNAKMGTVIMGNKKSDDLAAKGWQVYTRENGAWALNVSDGKNSYDYRPTAERQGINDGDWHQIAFGIDRDKNELWIYFDGKNVAIYNIPGLKELESELATIIGGSDEKWEYGSYGQWNAFNGFLDDVKVWDTALRPQEVKDQYAQYFPNKVQEDISFNPKHLKVLTWNIWHGGHRYGKEVGVQRVVETIKSTNADIIGLIETYGSGEIIADALGYYFYLISSNLSIMSRYPITETITAFRPFNFGGAKLGIGPGKELVFFDTWLHYLPDYGKNIVEDKMNPKELIKEEANTRHGEIKDILSEISAYLKKSDDSPIIMVGDFNSGSHLDWTKETKDIHYGKVVEWPVSKEMENAGFADSFRQLHLNPLLDPGFTWTPRAATSSDKYGLRDRIDYIYYKGRDLNPIESKVINYHPIMFPSDHAGVLTVFQLH